MKAKEVFVGRGKEIEQFSEFLKRKDCPAFVMIGEPGIGKSSFLKEIAKRLKSKYKGKVVVGFCEVPFYSGSVTTPFIEALENLMNELSSSLKLQVKDGVKRAGKVFLKVLKERGWRVAKSIVKEHAAKVVGKKGVEELKKAIKELKDLYEEWKAMPGVFSVAEEIISRYRDMFVPDLMFFLRSLVEEFKELEFVLVFDQFERALKPSCDALLDVIRQKPERVHVVVSFKVEKEGVAKFESVKSGLLRLNAEFLGLSPLSTGEIGEWILKARGKEFSYPELRKIRRLSAGFPFLISNWLRYSEELELDELYVGREGYCEFVEWCFEGLSKECLLLLRKISVLLQPLSVDDYEKFTGVKAGECSLLLEELEKSWILLRQRDTFWFRHELLKSCVERKLSSAERKNYHSDAGSFFQEKFDSSVKAGSGVEFYVGLGCAYHFHNSEKHEKSLQHNLDFAIFCFNTGWLDIAEECYLRAMDDAKELKYEDLAMVAKGNLANVYRVWGRLDEAFKTHQELFEYFREKKDYGNQSVALHQLAMIEQLRGNYDEASELYKQSLKIKRELGDKAGIGKSLHQLGRIEEDRELFEDAFKHFLNAAYLLYRLGSPEENTALDSIARTAKKISKQKLNKILQETPKEILTYLESKTNPK